MEVPFTLLVAAAVLLAVALIAITIFGGGIGNWIKNLMGWSSGTTSSQMDQQARITCEQACQTACLMGGTREDIQTHYYDVEVETSQGTQTCRELMGYGSCRCE